MTVDCLPFVSTTDRKFRVRASYNGGLVVARRDRRLLHAWADLFSRSVAAELKPLRGQGENVFASTGYVGPEASEYCGSNQAALALALWSRTDRVLHYPDSYNVPLHLLSEHPALARAPRTAPLVHVHYHWYFTEPFYQRALETLQILGARRDHLDWLRARIPLR